MKGEGEIVAVRPESEEEPEGAVPGTFDQVELMDLIEVWIAREELGAARPEDRGIDPCVGELQAEFAEDRGGLQGVSDPGQADDQDPGWGR